MSDSRLDMTSTTTAIASAPSSSHLFQNAAGFDIVGGQFVLGDVHNHQGAGPQAIGSSSFLNTLDEALSESEIYCSQMLLQKRGVPLFIPAPPDLPVEYREHGIEIGDVGSVTPEGEFDFYFNIFRSSEHPINAGNTPDDFVPMQAYHPRDMFHHDHGLGHYISTSTVRKVDLDPPAGEFPGGHFVFSCDSPQGAILALPHGAHVQKLRNVENMRAYAAEHAHSWYTYINGPRGRGLANGELFLITGCEKARSWGMASFHAAREEFQLFFKPTAVTGAAYNPYRWSGIHGQKNPSRRKSHDLPWTNEPVNQTTFIHGLSISLGTGLWGRLLGTIAVKTSPIADFQLQLRATGGSHSGGSQGSWSWNFLG
ncbi:hypothetical protein DFH06DRAFT_1047655, partial [Mycena polygramma]